MLRPMPHPQSDGREALREELLGKRQRTLPRQEQPQVPDGPLAGVMEGNACDLIHASEDCMAADSEAFTLAGTEEGAAGCTKRLHCLLHQHTHVQLRRSMQGCVVCVLVDAGSRASIRQPDAGHPASCL
jgi:hypothetical protein